jgi:hypothetical protein
MKQEDWILAGIGAVAIGAVVYIFIPKEDEGTLVLDLAEVTEVPNDSYCVLDGNEVATSLMTSTGVVLKAGVHVLAMFADADGDGQYTQMIQSQFQIQPKVRTRLVVHADLSAEAIYEGEVEE